MRSLFLAIALLAASGQPVLAQLVTPASPVNPTAAPTPSSFSTPVPSTPAPAAAAGYAMARERLDTMLKTGQADSNWFTASFLAQVPISQVETVLAMLTKNLGAYQSLDGSQGDYVAHFEKGTDEVLVTVDGAGKISGMLFRPAKVQ